jgi:hypothetical protein
MRYQVTGTCAPGQAFQYCAFECNTATTFWISAVQLEQATTASAYIGTTPAVAMAASGSQLLAQACPSQATTGWPWRTPPTTRCSPSARPTTAPPRPACALRRSSSPARHRLSPQPGGHHQCRLRGRGHIPERGRHIVVDHEPRGGPDAADLSYDSGSCGWWELDRAAAVG